MKFSTLKNYSSRVLLLLLYLFISSNVFSVFSKEDLSRADPRYSFNAIMFGEDFRPFAYRLLTKEVVKGVTGMIPQKLAEIYSHYRWKEKIDSEIRLAGIDPKLTTEWLVFARLSIIQFALFGYCIFHLLEVFYNYSNILNHMLAVLSISLIPLLFWSHNYLYDPSSLLLFPLAFLMLVKNRIIIYYFLFFVSILNKESSLLLIPIFFGYAVYHKESLNKSRLFIHLFLQCFLFFSITFAIRYFYKDLPGHFQSFQLVGNLKYIISPSISMLFFWVKVFIAIFLISYQWREKSLVLRKCFLFSFIPMLFVWFIFGRTHELRSINEIYFLLYLLAIPSFVAIVNREEEFIEKGVYRNTLKNWEFDKEAP